MISAHEIQRDRRYGRFASAAFVLIALFVVLVVLVVQWWTAFMNFVAPSILGPLFHSAAFIIGLLGCQFVMQRHGQDRARLAMMAAIVAGVAEWMSAWDIFNTSLASNWYRIVIGLFTVGMVFVSSWFLGGAD